LQEADSTNQTSTS